MERSLKGNIALFFKGIAMGAADVVPGVSGGTIAFISGIYEELLGSISGISLGTLKLLKTEGIKSVWKAINGNFLAVLLFGIAVSVVSLAKGISFLLTNHPILLWSFFFGLVLASVVFIGKQITKWNYKIVIAIIIGAITAYYITILEPLVSEDASIWFLFLSGALAICAMILPGISGSFILVLLGSYKIILEAIHSRNLQVIATVGAGAIVGLLSFSKVLKWLFANYKNMTLAALTGFIIGSLNKIWPWKETLTWRTNSHGEEVPLLQKSISPMSFDGEHQLMYAVLLAIAGYLVILGLEKVESMKKADS
jgi:putative membrane protein